MADGADLTVWGRRSSSNVQVAMWCIGELGLLCRRIDAGFVYGVTDTPEFLAMNPNGRVPVLRDGGDEPMFESGAILRYLAARYGDGGAFWPADPARRAQVDKWAEWAKVSVGASFTAPIFWAVVRTAPRDRDEAALARALRVLDGYLDLADADRPTSRTWPATPSRSPTSSSVTCSTATTTSRSRDPSARRSRATTPD